MTAVAAKDVAARERARHDDAVFAPWRGANGRLQAGGQTLERLAARVGATPFYVYSRDLLDARVAALRAALPAGVHLSYAVKANPMPAVVQHMAGRVDGFDVASAQEMMVALDTPMPAAHVSFAGPGKTDDELLRAVAAGVLVNLESAGEAERLAAAGRRLGLTPRAALRVNPDFELKASGMQMGGGPKAFGIDAETVPALLAELPRLGLAFEGFHIFSGSQNLSVEALCDIQEKTVALALRLAEHAPAPVRLLNLGGGFGIPYFPGDRPLDLAAVGANLARLLPEVQAALPEARVVVELGRYLVGEAGLYVCRVVDRKVSRGKLFLVTDGGLHHQLAASGNFGQVVRRNYPIAVDGRPGTGAAEPADVVGCLCTPIDVLGRNAELPAAEPGDLIAVFQSGAYGLTASPTAFLSHPPPAEVLV
jgi:diaminopimelate decarboxylase